MLLKIRIPTPMSAAGWNSLGMVRIPICAISHTIARIATGQCHVPNEKFSVGGNFFRPNAKFTTVRRYAEKSSTTPEAYNAESPYIVKNMIISAKATNNAAYKGTPREDIFVNLSWATKRLSRETANKSLEANVIDNIEVANMARRTKNRKISVNTLPR